MRALLTARAADQPLCGNQLFGICISRGVMKAQAIVSGILAVVCVCLFTTLLVSGVVSEVIYASLLGVFALVCIVLLVLPRLQELDLKNLRLTLREIRQVKAEVQEVKEDIAEMYGGIDNLRKQPLVLDKTKMEQLGLKIPEGVHPLTASSMSAVMRYPAGCIKRERERLARIFVTEKNPEKVAEAILDNSLDDKVFKWSGPETPLDAEPKSPKERAKEKEKGGEKRKS